MVTGNMIKKLVKKAGLLFNISIIYAFILLSTLFFCGCDREDPSSTIQDHSIIPHYEDRYYINSLSPKLQNSLITLYKSILAFEETCTFPEQLSIEEADLVITVLSYDCPELFQFAHNDTMHFITVNNMVNGIILPYTMDKAEYDSAYEKCMDMIGGISEHMQGMSKREKEKYVYDKLASLITYSTAAKNCENAFGALINGYAKCDGISLAMKWIMEENGIPTYVVTGKKDDNETGHAWNAVKFGETYYDLDLSSDVDTENKVMPLYGAYNCDRNWISGLYPVYTVLSRNFDLPGQFENHGSRLDGMVFVNHGDNVQETLFAALNDELMEAGDSGNEDANEDSGASGKCLLQFEDESDYLTFINNLSIYMRVWYSRNELYGDYTINYLDKFKVCGIDFNAAS